MSKQARKVVQPPTDDSVPDDFLDSITTFATGYNSRIAADDSIPDDVRLRMQKMVHLHLKGKFPINAFKDYCRLNGTSELGNIAASKLLKVFRSMKKEAMEEAKLED